MIRFLLDINVLIALIDPAHVQHDRAHRWFAGRGQKAWATCPLTENGVLRIVGNVHAVWVLVDGQRWQHVVVVGIGIDSQRRGPGIAAVVRSNEQDIGSRGAAKDETLGIAPR